MASLVQSVSRRGSRSLAIAGGGTIAAYLAAALAVLWRRRP